MKARPWFFATALSLRLSGSPMAVCHAEDATHADAKVYAPTPPYPYLARLNREQGFTLVEVTFGPSGSVADIKLKMSTGHPDLDDDTLQFARAHWRGPANSRGTVPVDYRLLAPGTSQFNRRPGPDGWYTPLPSYPTLSRRFMERGSGTITVATDARGRMIHAEMTKSTGAARLDQATTAYALSFWTGPPKSTKTIPVSYTMRMGSPGPN